MVKKKETLPGIAIVVVGLAVTILSLFIGIKFLFFQFIGIIMFCYGIVELYLFKDKSQELLSKEGHETRMRNRIPIYNTQNKQCAYCTMFVPKRAHICIYCGANLM